VGTFLGNKIPRSDSGTALDVIDLSTGATMGPTATMAPPGTTVSLAATIHYRCAKGDRVVTVLCECIRTPHSNCHLLKVCEQLLYYCMILFI
jgi:hypothetical protein